MTCVCSRAASTRPGTPSATGWPVRTRPTSSSSPASPWRSGAKTALPEWRADCVSRRLCILEREPVVVNLNGKAAERENPQLYLLRNAPVSRIEQYLL
jgi:hypothetical protein